jgi:hypothetical protein
MLDRYMALFARIRQYCEARHWFGPDDGLERDRATRDADGTLHVEPTTHDARFGFEFPPATAEQLRDTEARLGYPVPSLLRSVYEKVANGGFGPGLGLTRAHGGYWYGWDERYTTNEEPWSPWWHGDPIKLPSYGRTPKAPDMLTLPPKTWPDRFLHLCYWGCGTDTFLDAQTDHVYVALDINDYVVKVVLEDVSLEAWFERWLDGKRPEWQVASDVV